MLPCFHILGDGMRKHFFVIPLFIVMLLSLPGCAKLGLNFGKDSSIPKPTVQEQALMKDAATAEQEGDVEKAILLYSQAAQASEGSVLPHMQLARLFKEKGEYEKNAGVLAKAATFQPRNVEVIKELGNALIGLGKPAEALKRFDYALTLAPGDARLWSNKGVALDMMRRYADAQASYQEALKHDPSATYAENNLALSYLMSGKTKEATEILERLVRAENMLPEVRQNLALAYGLSGQPEKAMEMGLKDLPRDEAEANRRLYEGLQPAAGGDFKVPDTSVPAVMVAPVEPASSAPVSQ